MDLNSGSLVVEPETLVLYNDPVLLCAGQTIQNECTLVFKAIASDMITNSTLVFEPNVYQMQNRNSDNFPTESSLNNNQDYIFPVENEAEDSNQNLNMMNFFYKSVPKDQPEFVDVNLLTDSNLIGSKNSVKDNFVSDDENDVIFVKEYKREENTNDIGNSAKRDALKDEGIRRNPLRKARTIKGQRHLQKEHLLEEDFAVLDQIDEENLILKKTKSSSSTSTASSIIENYKEWPLNCYERPTFDEHTNKIEPIDFTLREVQNNQQNKKQRLETCSTVKRKPKKKYFIRKRKPKAKKIEKKIPINELKQVVESTFDLVGSFIRTSNTDFRDDNSDKDGIYDLIKNQTMLLAVVNNYGEKDVARSVNKVLGKS